jgi:uncharacterized membrane protein
MKSELSRWHLLLVVPVVLPLAIPLYNRTDPTLFGIPFFYWCQIAFSALSIVVVTVVYQATKHRP